MHLQSTLFIFAAVLLQSHAYLDNLILPGEKRFSSVRQLTFGGNCAEAYFSRNDQRISFQATNFGAQCDQIFKFDLSDGDTSKKAPTLVSTGLGKAMIAPLHAPCVTVFL